MNSELIRVIYHSICWLQRNGSLQQTVYDWMNKGVSLNYRIIHHIRLDPHHKRNLKNIRRLMETTDIRLQQEIVLLRETEYPNRNVPTFTSVTSQPMDAFLTVQQPNVYPIRIPEGTRLFYISALDEMMRQHIPFNEQEFLLEEGTTELVGGEIQYKPYIGC